MVCVLNNGDLAEVTWEHRETEGDPRYAPSQNLPHFPFAKYAELLGLRSIEVDDLNALAGAWKEAFRADRPVVIDVRTDPAVPLLPPFPAGGEKLDAIHRALKQEGSAGVHPLRLLDEYGRLEQRHFPS